MFFDLAALRLSRQIRRTKKKLAEIHLFNQLRNFQLNRLRERTERDTKWNFDWRICSQREVSRKVTIQYYPREFVDIQSLQEQVFIPPRDIFDSD